MVEFDDNDVFENWESVEGVTSNREFSTYVVFDEPPNTIDDEEKELYLPKWTKNAYFTDNIIGDVEGGVHTRHWIQ